MHDLDLSAHLPLIEGLICRYIEANVTLVDHCEAIDGKLGQARWGDPGELPRVLLPRTLSGNEIKDSLLALAMRGQLDGSEELAQFASTVTEPAVYLRHLVLHEVAHIANNRPQEMETQCDLWALAELKKCGWS